MLVAFISALVLISLGMLGYKRYSEYGILVQTDTNLPIEPTAQPPSDVVSVNASMSTPVRQSMRRPSKEVDTQAQDVKQERSIVKRADNNLWLQVVAAVTLSVSFLAGVTAMVLKRRNYKKQLVEH